MAKIITPAPLWGNPLNTLAQNGTNIAVIIIGDGSEMSSDKALKGKGKRKVISQKMALSLLDIAKRKEAPDRVKTYWNTYHCQNRLVSHNGKLYGKYCKNRCCTLCLSIRKADIINRYYPVMKDWENPYFVTLTIKACKATGLTKCCKP